MDDFSTLKEIIRATQCSTGDADKAIKKIREILGTKEAKVEEPKKVEPKREEKSPFNRLHKSGATRGADGTKE